MTEKGKYSTDLMKKHFNKKLVMTEEDNEDFWISSKCCDNVYADVEVKAKFNFKINVIPNGLEIYMSFNINNWLIFIDRVQFLSSLLDSLVRNLSKDDFKYLSQ